MNQVAPTSTPNGYADLYSSDSDDKPVFEEILINNNTVNPIYIYSVVTPSLTLASTLNKVLNNRRNTRHVKQIAVIKRSQSDTTASSRFLSTAFHSVSQIIICAHTDKIALYNKTDTACSAESGASEYMFPD